jgi:predicted methyltransferase
MRATLSFLALPLMSCSGAAPSSAPVANGSEKTAPELERAPAIPPVPDRPGDDVARDADRKPQEIMDLFGIAPGQSVVELMAGRGYYVELLAQRVGSQGRVYAHNSPFVLKRFAEGPISERLARPALANASRLDTEIDDPQLPPDLDAVMLVLFYHDTYWQGVDREQMNAAVFAALKPGGIYGVIDHHAEAGSGSRDVEELHRVDVKLVKQEILAAGFELETSSELLRHPEDDRGENVFTMRGKTDRFVLKFRKPS